MPDLLVQRAENNNSIAAYNMQRTSERTTAISAAAYLTHDTLDELIADADIILTWLRADNAVLIGYTPDAPQEAQNGTQEARTPSDGQSEPDRS